jgi:membrane associated rhomboid family serine protease
VFSVPPLTPVVKKLIITLFGAFVLELLLENFAGIHIVGLLALDPVHLGPASIIQLVTYVLVEDPRGVMSMLIGLLFMWLILSPFEAAFGPRHTLELALAGTLGASLSVVLAALIAPISPYLLFGSHPIAYAGMAAMTQVMRGGRILFFGVVPMTPRQLLLVLAGFSLLQYLASRDHLMLVGSLGAMLAGAGYVKYMARPPRPSKPKRPSSLRVLRGGGGGGGGPTGDSDRPKWLN